MSNCGVCSLLTVRRASRLIGTSIERHRLHSNQLPPSRPRAFVSSSWNVNAAELIDRFAGHRGKIAQINVFGNLCAHVDFSEAEGRTLLCHVYHSAHIGPDVPDSMFPCLGDDLYVYACILCDQCDGLIRVVHIKLEAILNRPSESVRQYRGLLEMRRWRRESGCRHRIGVSCRCRSRLDNKHSR